MTVYIEYALIDNLVIDYLILKATFKISGVSRTKGRLFLSAFFASVVALVFPLINSALISTILKLLLPITVVASSGSFRSKKEFILSVCLFLGVTFILGGSASGIFSFFNIELGSEVCVSIVILPVYLSVKFILRLASILHRKKTFDNFMYFVTIVQNGKAFSLRGFLDTGNGVYDGENPVVFIRKKLAKKLFEQGKITKVKELEINTVNGCDKKILFNIDGLEIRSDKEKYIYNNVSVCVSDNIGYNYDLLLHPALFEVDNENDSKMQKVV